MGHPWLAAILVVAILLLHAAGDDLAPPSTTAAPPQPAVTTPKRAPRDEVARAAQALLAGRNLVVPVQGVPRAKVRDTFHEKRGTSRMHKALDIMAPWGTPVLAADDGKVAKISRNRAGGLAVYQVDPTGRLVYYYAHLAGYADGLREGQVLRRGDVIGYVGATGNAPAHAPHLHFAVQVLTRQGRWWGGEAVNPYEALRGEAVAGE
jgi:murein DD-endopeptidase MepM/ murein hydrolase activator NlpD